MVDGKIMYSNIVQTIAFISKFLCFNNGSWMSCFGRLTWPRMSDMIISNFLAKVCVYIVLVFNSSTSLEICVTMNVVLLDAVSHYEKLQNLRSSYAKL